ncbi:complement C1q tumor necrosis factor-related protein 2-like isoform X2 [Dreissena polymorpha]|uniref:complement C1q tumor necrosis factor-related protein 2-like isoform X2 n=1 Tax=Dreissena polymorpha TaxID=45954 RepID=UPI00226444D9|nr:complement C1q tumor necrosis factor-related protein 2-like isoform X2 [Dreissena polymorpha]
MYFSLLPIGYMAIMSQDWMQPKMLLGKWKKMMLSLNATLQNVGRELAFERQARQQMEKHLPAKQGLITRQASKELEVAFFAQIVVFDKVITNIDSTGSIGGYHASTGVFTAPVDSLYVFYATLMAHNNHASHYLIVHENQSVATILVDGSNHWFDSASGSVVVVLSRGDTVSVKQLESGDHALQGAPIAGESSFSGFLLRQHFRGPAPIG